jgi:hypothetical protein
MPVYIAEVIKHMDNLRSGLAKNSLLTLYEMCFQL